MSAQLLVVPYITLHGGHMAARWRCAIAVLHLQLQLCWALILPCSSATPPCQSCSYLQHNNLSGPLPSNWSFNSTLQQLFTL